MKAATESGQKNMEDWRWLVNSHHVTTLAATELLTAARKSCLNPTTVRTCLTVLRPQVVSFVTGSCIQKSAFYPVPPHRLSGIVFPSLYALEVTSLITLYYYLHISYSTFIILRNEPKRNEHRLQPRIDYLSHTSVVQVAALALRLELSPPPPPF
jgi:hypothetical protein